MGGTVEFYDDENVFSYERVVGFYDDVQNSTDMMKTSLSAQFAGPLL